MTRAIFFAAACFAASSLRAADPASTVPKVPNAVSAAQSSDVAYASQLARAWKGDEDAIGAMFDYQQQGFFENKSRKAEAEHRRVLWLLLQHLGDERFEMALDREYPRVQREVVRAIALEAGPDLARYPKTAARRNAE